MTRHLFILSFMKHVEHNFRIHVFRHDMTDVKRGWQESWESVWAPTLRPFPFSHTSTVTHNSWASDGNRTGFLLCGSSRCGTPPTFTSSRLQWPRTATRSRCSSPSPPCFLVRPRSPTHTFYVQPQSLFLLFSWVPSISNFQCKYSVFFLLYFILSSSVLSYFVLSSYIFCSINFLTSFALSSFFLSSILACFLRTILYISILWSSIKILTLLINTILFHLVLFYHVLTLIEFCSMLFPSAECCPPTSYFLPLPPIHSRSDLLFSIARYLHFFNILFSHIVFFLFYSLQLFSVLTFSFYPAQIYAALTAVAQRKTRSL